MARHRIHKSKIVEELMAIRQPLDAKCSKEIEGVPHICSRVDMGEYCKAYAFPSKKWRNGDCPLADTELKTAVSEEIQEKVRVGQQKQKKRKK